MVDTGTLLAIITGLCGLAGLVYTALHFNRDDAKALVDQQSAVLKDMGELNTDLRATVADLRTERDALRSEVADLREQVQRLSHGH